MRSLIVRLLGASDNEVQELARALAAALLRSDWPATVRTRGQGPDHSDHDLIFLIGLGESSDMALQADASIRASLSRAGLGYSVLHGSFEERSAQARLLVHNRLAENGFTEPAPDHASDTLDTGYTGDMGEREKASRWVWQCEKCSDPQCERKLLSALLAKRLTEPLPGAAADGRGV